MAHIHVWPAELGRHVYGDETSPHVLNILDNLGVIVPEGPPSETNVWNGSAGVDDLDKLRARLRGEVNPQGGAGIEVTIAEIVHVLQTDEVSRQNIDRAALGATIGVLPLNADGSVNGAGTGKHISWRMRDNRDVLLDGPTFIASIAVPLGLHINACHLASRAHKTAIAAATRPGLSAYDLSQGWPPVASV